MKFHKNVLTLFFITLLVTGCGEKSNNRDKGTQKDAQQTLGMTDKTTNDINGALKDFKEEVNALIEELSKKKSEIQLDSFNNKYENLKKQSSDNTRISGFLAKNEFLALTKISYIKLTDENSEESQKIKIKALQKSLKLDQNDQTGIFADKSSNKLMEFLQGIINGDDLSPIVVPGGAGMEIGTNKAPFDLNWLIIAAIVISGLSIGSNALLYWLLNQSNNRFRILEKKVQDNRDDVKKWSAKVEQRLSSQQSEIDRKLQQQRQPAKGSSSPEPAQVYKEREQFGYEETFNPLSAQSPSPYVSPERASYPRVESTPRTYQAPQSSHEIIAQQYNTNPSSIATSAQGVSETEDSIYRRRRDSSIKQVTLQSISNYGYWVIADTEGVYWLTPIAEPKLNPMNFDTFQALFHFNGEPLSGKLQLVKPAKVTQVSTGQWELMDRGEVQFI